MLKCSPWIWIKGFPVKMERKKSRLIKILIEIVVVIVMVMIIFKLVEYFTGVNPMDNLFKRKEALENINEVAAKLTREVDQGVDGEVVLYMKDIPDEELKSINYIMSNLNGSIDSYSVYPKLFGVRRVSFTIVRSDNSYVFDAYKNGTPIPQNRPEAQKLLVRVKQILGDNLSGVMTDYQKELKLHDYLVEHCTYSHGSSENDNEYRAYGALVEGEAVCNGYAEAMDLMLSCAGVQNQYVVGTANSGSRRYSSDQQAGDESGRTENHAWNLVLVNGTWYHLDATWDDPMGDEEIVSHAYFNMSDDLMARDHIWDKEKYDSCPDMSWNYFHRENAYFENSYDLDRYVTQRLMIRPYGTMECAFSQFEMTNTTLTGINTVPTIKKVMYSTIGGFNFTVLTLYVSQ